ncbi:hypothetical protein [Mangrovicoccus ximenensis]|nr:hypothetical protein [Mangrovicoccus ximenensis]
MVDEQAGRKKAMEKSKRINGWTGTLSYQEAWEMVISILYLDTF